MLAALALVAGACGGAEETTTDTEPVTVSTTAGSTAETVEATTTEVTVDLSQAGTLAEVQARGSLRCGVSTSAIGFAEPQDDGSFKGFDADYCRAVAAAVLGDANAVEFVGTTAAERFNVLAAGEIDVLFRNTTWTQSRDTEIGGDFGLEPHSTPIIPGQQLLT